MGELVSGLESTGGTVLPFPVIEVRDIDDKRLLDLALEALSEYAWIVFTSVHGVSFFFRRLNERSGGAGIPAMPKICAIGPATAKAVAELGHKVALVAEQFVAEGIVEAFEKHAGGLRSLSGSRILIARAKEGREVLPEVLRKSGIHVDVVPCYQTVRADLDESRIERIRGTNPDLIVFTSSSTVRNMIDILGLQEAKRMLLESVVAVLGPVTGRTAESFGKRPEIVPKENTIASLLHEIIGFYSGKNLTEDRP
jgi:uroporphyrinogen-III synthase